MGLDVDTPRFHKFRREAESLEIQPDLDEQEEPSCCGCCNPRHPHYPYLLLPFFCLFTFGILFSIDIPAALSSQLIEELNLTSYQYNALYASNAAASVCLCFAGGYVVDWIGARWSAVLFTGMCLLSQIIFTYGVYSKDFTMLIVGRVALGIADDSTNITQAALIVGYFKRRGLAWALGVALVVARLGTISAFMTLPTLHDMFGLTQAVAIGIGVTLVGFIASLFVICLDVRAARRVRLKYQAASTSEPVLLNTIYNFGLLFWVLVVICMMYYATLNPFTFIGSDYLHQKYGYSSVMAGFMISIIYDFVLVVAPLAGSLIDKIGCRPYLMMLSCFTLLPAFVILGFFSDAVHPLVPICILGLSLSFFAATVFPSMTLIVRQFDFGVAMGILFTFQNIGLVIQPLIVGHVIDETQSYDAVMLLFVGMAAATFAISVAFVLLDACWYSGKLSVVGGVVASHHGGGNTSGTETSFSAQEDEEKPLIKKG